MSKTFWVIVSIILIAGVLTFTSVGGSIITLLSLINLLNNSFFSVAPVWLNVLFSIIFSGLVIAAAMSFRKGN